MSNKHTITYDPEKSDVYKNAELQLADYFFDSSIPKEELVENSFLFLTTQHVKRNLFFYELYKKIVDVPGVIMQFGARWGRHLAYFDSLRTIFEPFNYSRKIIGFDTFTGFKDQFDAKDSTSPIMKEGYLATTQGYEDELDKILKTREMLAPMSHVKKYEIIKGDVMETLPAYFDNNPHTVVALIHLDINLFKPTKYSLELLKKHVTKGSIIVIDEMGFEDIPGQTLAVKEAFGLDNIRLQRVPIVNPTWPAFFVIE